MSASMVNGRILTRPEYTLHVDEVGDDVPLLVIHHALSSFGALLEPGRGNLPAALAARGCRVIGFDLPGHGLSQPVVNFPADYLDRVVDDAVAVLESSNVGAAAGVVGIGFGSLVALRLAALTPRRVRCVVADSIPGVLTSTPLEPWPGTAPHSAEGYDLLPAWVRYLGQVSGVSSFFPAGFRIDVPTLLVACGAGSAGETTRLYTLARAIGGAEIAWAPTEFPPACWSAPEFFLAQVEQFLAAHA